MEWHGRFGYKKKLRCVLCLVQVSNACTIIWEAEAWLSTCTLLNDYICCCKIWLYTGSPRRTILRCTCFSLLCFQCQSFRVGYGFSTEFQPDLVLRPPSSRKWLMSLLTATCVCVYVCVYGGNPERMPSRVTLFASVHVMLTTFKPTPSLSVSPSHSFYLINLNSAS